MKIIHENFLILNKLKKTHTYKRLKINKKLTEIKLKKQGIKIKKMNL